MTLQEGPKLLVSPCHGYRSSEISHGNGMVLLVIGVDTIASKEDFVVSLICINGRHTNASMGIYARNDDPLDIVGAKNRIQLGSEEAAVTLLNDHEV